MKLSRRDFIHAGCAAGAVALTPHPVEAWTHGAAVSGVNNNRVTLNPDMGYLNIAKNFNFAIDPANQSTNGYPVVKPTSGWLSNPALPLAYYDQYVWKWQNLGAIIWTSAPPMIVTTSTVNGSNAPVIFELPAGTGDVAPGNKNFFQSTSIGLNTPRLVFYTGWNIQAISDNGSGLIRFRRD